MSSNSDRDARMRDAKQGGGPRDQDWLAGRIAARSGSEVTVSGMPCEAVSGDAVRREVVSALKQGDSRPVERVVFLTIGEAHPDSRGDSQALIDKFLRRRQALEEWVPEAGFRVVAGYLRPAGDLCSAVFDLEPLVTSVAAAPMISDPVPNCDATVSRQMPGRRR